MLYAEAYCFDTSRACVNREATQIVALAIVTSSLVLAVKLGISRLYIILFPKKSSAVLVLKPPPSSERELVSPRDTRARIAADLGMQCGGHDHATTGERRDPARIDNTVESGVVVNAIGTIARDGPTLGSLCCRRPPRRLLPRNAGRN